MLRLFTKIFFSRQLILDTVVRKMQQRKHILGFPYLMQKSCIRASSAAFRWK